EHRGRASPNPWKDLRRGRRRQAAGDKAHHAPVPAGQARTQADPAGPTRLSAPAPAEGTPMATTAGTFPEGQRFILSALPPSLAQRRLALAVMIALILAFLVTVGLLSTFQLGRIDAFVPTYATALFVTDLITAVLLFAQFSIVRSRALAVLASGYLFAALVVIPWMLTFPGVFAPGGLLGAGPYTSQWLYTTRQLGFPMFVIAYALLKDADPTKRLWQGSVAAGILSSVALTAALVCAATVLVTAGHALLPRTMLDSLHF